MTDVSPSSPTWTALPARGVVRVTGVDRVGFLQGLLTNDVTVVESGRAIYAALLTPQGKILHDLLVAPEAPGADGALLLDVEAARRADLLERLSRYRLRAKVAFEDLTGAWEALALIGPDAPGTAGLPATEGATRALAGGVALVDPRLAALGVRLLLPVGARETAIPGAIAGAPEDHERLRLGLGVPDGARDLTPDKALPLECGLDALNGVSWTKGCYVGQEVTARMRYRGLARRRLVPVRVDGPLPEPGTAVRQGEREVGEVRSGLGDRALASLRVDTAEDAAAAPLTAGAAILTTIIPTAAPS